MPAQSRIQLYGLWLGQSDITSHENNKSQTDWGRLFNRNYIVPLLSVFTVCLQFGMKTSDAIKIYSHAEHKSYLESIFSCFSHSFTDFKL